MMMTYLERTEKPEKSIPVVNSPQKIPASETGISVNSHAAWSHQQLTTIADQSSGISQLQAYSDLANSGEKVTQLKNVQQLADSNAVVQLQKWSTGKLDGKQSEVDWWTQTIGGEKVGVEMEATMLGPDHLQGTPPQSGVQKNIMNKLPTDPHLNNEKKYVRGHLLNDNLGGMGEDYNLFPITASANKAHENVIESKVKQWVNEDKQWVYYKVKVTNIVDQLKSGYINAVFDCQAAIVNPTSGIKNNSISARIESKHDDVVMTNIDNAKDRGIRNSPGKDALAHTPLLSTSKKVKQQLGEDGLQSLRVLFSDPTATLDIQKRLLKIKGIGKTTVENLSAMDVDEEMVDRGVENAIHKILKKISEKDLYDIINAVYEDNF